MVSEKGSQAYRIRSNRAPTSSFARARTSDIASGTATATVASPPDTVSAGSRASSHKRPAIDALIREAFDEKFFSLKYRRRFMGRALEPHAVALETYLRFVTKDRLDPNAEFSEEKYLQANLDIMERVATGRLLCGFEHWLQYGKAEGRATVKASVEDEHINPILKDFNLGFFARKYRRRFAGRDLQNLDVALSLYVSFVSLDYLDPNANFSESDYLRENSDVKDAVQRGMLSSGFAHWVTFGRTEGRKTFPALTFDGPSSASRGAVIPQQRSPSDGASPLCLRQEEFDEMLRHFDKGFFRRAQKHRRTPPGGRGKNHIFYDYLNLVSTTPVDPNARFSEVHYLASNMDVATAVKEGGYLSGYHHWVLHGRVENRVFQSAASRAIELTSALRVRSATKITFVAEQRAAFRNCFQYSYYRAFFPISRLLDADAAFDYFMNVDLMNGVVPVDENTFDERFYTCYYGDVQAEKIAGHIPSGYFHYVLAGRSEGRLPTYCPGPLLKAKLGDSADPIGIANTAIIARRLKPIMPQVQSTRPILLNVFVPTLDGDLMFGGYIAFLNFLCRVAEHGVALRFIIREDLYGNAAWFLRSIGNRPRWLKAFGDQEVVNATVVDDQLAFHSEDLCIAYSTWTMFDAWSVARHLQNKRPVFFIQEYEPIFHDHNSFSFVMASAYRLPHLAIFNSSILTQYFKHNEIGVFSEPQAAPFFSFENPLTPMQKGRRPSKSARRRLICYTRPERHAGRNMFEVCILALRDAIKRGVFPGNWEFLGIGSLGNESEIDLGPGAALTILPRMPQDDYERFLLSFDVGLSLMWAPHPSVMPFELAGAGVVTVTNEFGGRTRDTVDRFGTNLILATPTLDGIIAGLQEAVHRSDNVVARRAASAIDWPRSWDEVFTPPFIDHILTAARESPGRQFCGEFDMKLCPDNSERGHRAP